MTREDKIWNWYIRGSVELATITVNMSEDILRLWKHILWKEKTDALTVVMKIMSKEKRYEEDQKIGREYYRMWYVVRGCYWAGWVRSRFMEVKD